MAKDDLAEELLASVKTKINAKALQEYQHILERNLEEEREQCKESFPDLLRYVKAGDGISAYELGNMYYGGKGVEQDYNRALEWYLKGAELGCPGYMYYWIGCMYEDGKGCEKNAEKTIEYYMKGVKHRSAESARNLGRLYYNGIWVEKDYMKALFWYLKAEELGYKKAFDKIGFMYEHGQGCKKDMAKAEEYYRKEAGQ